MDTALLAMMGLLWVAMIGLYRQMGRLETILSFWGRHAHNEGTGRPVAGFSEDSD